MILFQANVAVPAHIVEQIGSGIKQLLIKTLASRGLKDDRFDELTIHEISMTMNDVVDAYAARQEKSCEGWTLTKDQAELVAFELRNDRKIMAIKQFRTATGAGLRDSKLFLDKFGLGNVGAIEFMAVFV